MDLFRNLEISASALTAERLRMDLISDNIANVHQFIRIV
jgi:flagellar basal body rod protein FlgC